MKTFLEYLAEAELLAEADTPANASKLHPGQAASLSGAMSMPDISNNKSNGSAYLQYRFGIALGGASDKKEDSYKTPPAGAFAGDPLILTYSDAEDKMVQNASDFVGAGKTIPIGSKRSEEHSEVHKVSPHRNPGPITLKRK